MKDYLPEAKVQNGNFPHGQIVFEYKGKYYTQDIDGHSTGVWKGAARVSDLWSKQTRSGTYGLNFNYVGP